MKFVAPLDEQTLTQLRGLIHESTNARLRQRALAIVLSHKRYRIAQIADICEVDRDTVSRWLDQWRQRRFQGLHDEPRPGRPSLLRPEQEDQACAIALEQPRQIRTGLARIAAQFGIRPSLEWLRRLLRRHRMRYKRIRASLRAKCEQAAFQAAAQELVALQQEEAAGRIKLYYGDAAGFALRPALSYAWQPIGARIAVPQTGRAQVNVLGFLRRSGEFIPYLSEGMIDSETVIACLDALAAQADKPTVVVLDNASVHRSAAVEARRGQWERQGMRLYFLPKYAPELNLIEHLWRAIKYRWLSWSAYQSMAALRQELEQVLIGIGTKYRITFS